VLKNEIRNSTIDYLEFGVAEGRSFKWWIEHHKDANSRFYGFDTFTGLPENWDFYRQGDMTAGGKTPVVTDSRCLFIKGLFQETLPFFLKDYKRQDKLVVHLDADLYSSTLYVLASLAPVLKAGDILVFDEFGVPTHEFKAFEDFTSAFYMKYELIAAGNNYFQIALKIL
jgi:hypothetical protein